MRSSETARPAGTNGAIFEGSMRITSQITSRSTVGKGGRRSVALPIASSIRSQRLRGVSLMLAALVADL